MDSVFGAGLDQNSESAQLDHRAWRGAQTKLARGSLSEDGVQAAHKTEWLDGVANHELLQWSHPTMHVRQRHTVLGAENHDGIGFAQRH